MRNFKNGELEYIDNINDKNLKTIIYDDNAFNNFIHTM